MHRNDRTPATAGTSPAAGAASGAALEGLDVALGRLDEVDVARLGANDLALFARGLARAASRIEGQRARAVVAADDSGAAASIGAVGGAQWLSQVTGTTPRAASRTARLGRAMQDVPALDDAVRTGRVDSEQATTLAGAADRGLLDGEDVEALVDAAGDLPAGALARETRRREQRADCAKLRRDEAHARARRSASWRTRDDGSVEGEFLLDPVAGRVVTTALRSLVVPDAADTPDDARRSPAQRRADALTELARHSLDRGDPGSIRAARPHVTVVVPVSALADDDATAEHRGEHGTFEDGAPLSVGATRQLLCDATVRRLVVDPDGRPLDVGRATRTWSGAQRAASAAIDGGCRGPACDRPFAWTDLHHVRWWRDGGTTGIDNGLPVCRHCHDLVHHEGWHLDLLPDDRTAIWTSPTGEVTRTHPRGPAVHRRR